jgi:hypothetical protein
MKQLQQEAFTRFRAQFPYELDVDLVYDPIYHLTTLYGLNFYAIDLFREINICYLYVRCRLPGCGL